MLNVSINPTWRNFLDRGFFIFRWVKKKVWSALFGHFWHDLKKYFNICNKMTWEYQLRENKYTWCACAVYYRFVRFKNNEKPICIWGRITFIFKQNVYLKYPMDIFFHLTVSFFESHTFKKKIINLPRLHFSLALCIDIFI